jgi:hypothetical protein
VEELEGCYICFRPGFTAADLINAYLVVIRWDEAESCLVFEEQGRADAPHTQKGRIYIPDGCPFLNLVTNEKGSIRLITVSRPEKQEPARGLIMTLSNPSGRHFTPSSAPILLRRVTGEMPHVSLSEFFSRRERDDGMSASPRKQTCYYRRNSFGNFAIFAAICRASRRRDGICGDVIQSSA